MNLDDKDFITQLDNYIEQNISSKKEIIVYMGLKNKPLFDSISDYHDSIITPNNIGDIKLNYRMITITFNKKTYKIIYSNRINADIDTPLVLFN